MFERKLEQELIIWKDRTDRKPLILRGARQVGKTSLIRKFGKEHFSEVLEINLEKKEQKKMFDGVESITDFVKRVELLIGKTITDGKTLVFIDEIQESKEMLELLRFFAEERPHLHIIAAGSLLEAKMGGEWNVPVGRVEYMYLYPLTFFEFLGAVGQGRWGEYLKKVSLSEKTAGEEIIKENFRNYMIVGGMPEAVSDFSKEPGFVKVGEIQNRLRTAYIEDIGKYARDAEKKYLELVMEIAPRVAGGIFKYENFGESGYRGREVQGAISLLQKVMLLREVQAVNSTSLPLMYKYKRAKKMIWLDVGMVNEANNSYRGVVEGRYQGKIMEQMVGQTLIAGGTRRLVDLSYWARNRDEGSAEVDFCFQYGDKVVAMEVKSGNMREMKSLFSMINSGNGKVIAVRASWDKLGIENYQYGGKKYKVLSLPFYLLERWEDFVSA